MTVNEWFEQYKEKSGGRYETFRKAFELFHKINGNYILETGCVRLPDDWGAGMSTYLFGEYAKIFGAHVFTVDISQVNMDQCKDVTKEFQKDITYCVDDSLHFLKEFDRTVNLLYLDSMDCPLVDDPNYPELIQSQTHQLNELKLALPLLSPDGIILLDDNGFANGGKTKMSKEYLKEQGWKEILGGQQSLWTR